MSTYEEMTRDELLTLKDALQKEYDEYCALNLSLNMARGKPAKDQLDLNMPMLDIISSTTECVDEAFWTASRKRRCSWLRCSTTIQPMLSCSATQA